jgi:sulfatase maturation enzyme AslB (radical SAM superfamily)
MELMYVVMRENLNEVLPFIEFATSALHPYCIQFQPVKHVMDWHTTNGTGWVFDGKKQSCESFKDQYNDMMRRVAEKCTREGIKYEIQLV